MKNKERSVKVYIEAVLRKGKLDKMICENGELSVHESHGAAIMVALISNCSLSIIECIHLVHLFLYPIYCRLSSQWQMWLYGQHCTQYSQANLNWLVGYSFERVRMSLDN